MPLGGAARQAHRGELVIPKRCRRFVSKPWCGELDFQRGRAEEHHPQSPVLDELSKPVIHIGATIARFLAHNQSRTDTEMPEAGRLGTRRRPKYRYAELDLLDEFSLADYGDRLLAVRQMHLGVRSRFATYDASAARLPRAELLR